MGQVVFLLAAIQMGVVVYVLVLLTGMARNIARQSDSLERIADRLDRDGSR